MSVRLACVADTHGREPKVPAADVFVHAGDLTERGSPYELESARDWIASLPHEHKVVVFGNHDIAAETFEAVIELFTSRGIVVLRDSGAEVAGLQFWGSPYSTEFFPEHWGFQVKRGGPARLRWSQIPEGLDVLVTHGPPFGAGDRVAYGVKGGRLVQCVGDYELLERLVAMRQPPRVHLFGHIHCDPGRFQIFNDGEHPTRLYNVTTDYGKRAATVLDL